jgi:hypothetical protein
MWGFCTAEIRDESMIMKGNSTRANIGYDFALHELAHWCVQAINVTMHGHLEVPLRVIPLW